MMVEAVGSGDMRWRGHLASAAGLAILTLAGVILPVYYVTTLTQALIFAILAMSLDLLMGYTGLVSLGHAAFFGTAGYVAGLVAVHWTSHLAVTLIVGVLASGLAALMMGGLVIRTRGVYFLMLTLALSQLLYSAAFVMELTGGSNGLPGVPRPTTAWPLLDHQLESVRGYYMLVVLAFLLTFWLLRRMVASPFGHALVGIRENELRMRAIGYPTVLYKLKAFVVAGLFAGLAGVLYVHANRFVSPEDLHWITSGNALIMVIVGGTGTLVGPIWGALLFVLLQMVVSSYMDSWEILMGLMLVFFVYVSRDGLFGIYRRLGSRWSPSEWLAVEHSRAEATALDKPNSYSVEKAR